ncbi:MAG TPA: hypothetical protein VF787_25065, partial [Thermoanaerobaculia bacterium]
KAMNFVRDTASRGGHDPVHVVFAGATPQLAGGATLAEKLRGWTCNAATGDLDAAIGFATQVGGPSALVLVVTDRAPESQLEKGSLTWRAFGTPRDNVAFAVAARGSERVLLEVMSYAKSDQTRTLTLSDGKSMPVALRPGESKRLQFNASGAKPFEARLSGDDALFDDRVVLLPESRPPVRVALQIAHPQMRTDVEQALRASGRVALTDVRSDLIVTDGAPPTDGWSVVLRTSKATRAVTGPYVLDRTHPLLRGLSFEGLIWGVPAELKAQPPSNPLVLVGTEALLSEERVSGGQRIRMRLDPTISNVQRAPVWPAFWWNVLDWRSANAPGVRISNVILGSDARVRIEGPRALAIAPDGTRRESEPSDGEVVIEATQRGIWSVQLPTARTYRFAVNAIVPSESDLTRTTSGTWGGWSEESLLSSGYQDVAWLALLLALVVLAWHHLSLWRAVPATGSAS